VTRARWIAGIAAGSIGGGLLLSLADGKGFTPAAWAAYSALLAISLAVVFLAFLVFQRQGASDLILWLALATLALRLVVGVALARTLPDWGYDENAQNRGYVFYDSYKRDTDAWQRARGDRPLLASPTPGAAISTAA
jgi:hypothetical protein